MNTLQAFAMGEAHRHERRRVFDWDRAARFIVEYKPRRVEAGLRDDWEWTGGTIYEDGCPVRDDYTYLASTWAIPEIALDGDVEPCWC